MVGDAGVAGDMGALGEAGAGGAGGALDSGYRFVLVPALARPELVPKPTLPDDRVTTAVTLQAVTPDGSVMIGVSSTIFSRPGDPFKARHDEETIWHDFDNPESLGTELIADIACLAEDGKAALFENYDAESVQRWSEGQGIQVLGIPAGVTDPWLSNCSADAKRAAFQASHAGKNALLYWELGRNQGAMLEAEVPEPNLSTSLVLAKDGGPGLLATNYPIDDLNNLRSRSFRWSPENGLQALGTPEAESCVARGLSGDGSVVVGSCESGAFRLTPDGLKRDGAKVELYAVSRNSQTVLGARYDGPNSRLVWIRSDGALEESKLTSPNWWGVFSLSDDGLTGYVRYQDTSFGPSVPYRWSADGTLTALPLLEGHASSELLAVSSDGTLAVGVAYEAGRHAMYAGRLVVWDSQGARDVVAELASAGLPPPGVDLVQVERIWGGSAVHLQGTCATPDGKIYTAFVAELPLR